MAKLLHFQFNEIGFNIYADEVVLEDLKCFWELTMNVQYDLLQKNDWSIHVQLWHYQKEHAHVDYEKKSITYNVYQEYSINRINSFIREFITKTSLTLGYIWLHAAAFSIQNKGYIVIGPKGFGKSTHLLNAYFNYNAEIIGNDQIPIKLKNGSLVSYRWRPDVKVAPSTLQIINKEFDAEKKECTDRFLWMPDSKQYATINFKDLSLRRKQRIEPLLSANMRMSEQREFSISKIIFLDDIEVPIFDYIDSKRAKIYWDHLLKNDHENLNPQKLLHWKNLVPYWKERIQGMILESDAENQSRQTESFIIYNMKKFRLFNRIDFNEGYMDSIIQTKGV